MKKFREIQKGMEVGLPPHTRQLIKSPQRDENNEIIPYGVGKSGFPDIWETFGTDGKGMKIAVIDTGVFPHVDLVDNINTELAVSMVPDEPGWEDEHGHGTHCSSSAAGPKNQLGIVGVAPGAEIIPIKVLNKYGSGMYEWVTAGVDYAVEIGADVVSMSLGGPDSDMLKDAVTRGLDKGVLFSIAAGNSGPGEDTVDCPGNHPGNIITVGAHDIDWIIAWFSSRGKELDTAAPGVDVLGAVLDDMYEKYSGTSMATPHVAGFLALMKAYLKNNGLVEKATPEFMYNLISITSQDAGKEGPDSGFGYGIIDPLSAFLRLRNLVNEHNEENKKS